jgi:hypothetical protein
VKISKFVDKKDDSFHLPGHLATYSIETLQKCSFSGTFFNYLFLDSLTATVEVRKSRNSKRTIDTRQLKMAIKLDVFRPRHTTHGSVGNYVLRTL